MFYLGTEEEPLRELFKDCGEIESVRLIRDSKTGVGKGFGFILFKVSIYNEQRNIFEVLKYFNVHVFAVNSLLTCCFSCVLTVCFSLYLLLYFYNYYLCFFFFLLWLLVSACLLVYLFT